MVSGEAKEIALRSSRLFSGRLASRTRASVFRARETRKALHRGDAHVIMRALTRSNAALFPGGGGGDGGGTGADAAGRAVFAWRALLFMVSSSADGPRVFCIA